MEWSQDFLPSAASILNLTQIILQDMEHLKNTNAANSNYLNIKVRNDRAVLPLVPTKYPSTNNAAKRYFGNVNDRKMNQDVLPVPKEYIGLSDQ